ncbi:MAG: inorganic phosphate transporter [Verrucomicrobia bacterium]|nr:inorganic phosphate transporter [Verrucomicrobiota bacterium]
MNIGGEQVTAGVMAFAAIGICISLFFEFINGFHDTANAVATVIYTHSLPPTAAVIWSGIWNFIGVLLSSGTVAYSVVAILPPTLVLNVSSGTGAAALFALLLGAVAWNFGTWYFGMPCSSSHSLIGSMLGVSLVYTLIDAKRGGGIHWDQAGQVFLSLLISPIVGFVAAALILLALRRFVKTPGLFEPANPEKSPPRWVRGLLVITCTGVSFAHGSNDGQKGMGLLMLVLIVALPSSLALNSDIKPDELQRLTTELDHGLQYLGAKEQGKQPPRKEDAKTKLTEYNAPKGEFNDEVFPALITELKDLRSNLTGKSSIEQIPLHDRPAQRQSAFLAQQTLKKLVKQKQIGEKDLDALEDGLKKAVEYIPIWVKAAVALALGVGTMIGWRRIVTTVAERIGKTHLAYAQGASAELTTMGTIFLADNFGLPVSTTHVLTSGIAGTMAANQSGLQKSTLRNIILAWVLTLPVCFFLGATLFAGMLYLFFNILGWK